MRLIILFIFLSPMLGWGSNNRDEITQQYIFTSSNIEKSLKFFHDNDIDISGIDYEKNRIGIVTSPKVLKNIFLKNPKFGLFHQLAITQELLPDQPDSEYTDYKELTERLASWSQQFPKIFSYQSLGKTNQGREVWAAKITASEDLGIPSIVVTGMHHAREVMSTEVSLDLIEMLLKGYETDPGIQDIVANKIIYVVPMVNPDGNNMVWNGRNMWRKNAWKNTRGEIKGVDLNRNYNYKWKACNGASNDEDSETFRGPKPASEPETRALQKFVGKVRPFAQISFHSYSELVIFPYGCPDNKEPDKEVIEEVGTNLGALIPRDSGSGSYKAGWGYDLLYPVDGNDSAYMYAKYGVLAYVVELNAMEQGFQPKFSPWQAKTTEKVRPAMKYLINRIDGPAIEVRVTDHENGETLGGAEITARNVMLGNGESLRTTNAFGRYFQVVKSGLHEITISYPGKESKTVLIDVGTKREVVTVEL